MIGIQSAVGRAAKPNEIHEEVHHETKGVAGSVEPA